MQVTVNGNPTELPGNDPTVIDLLKQLDLAGRPVAVEVNKQLVPKSEHAATKIKPDDTIELVTLVGGG